MKLARFRARGFTLIEAMSAMAVTTIGLVGMLGAFAQARGATGVARLESRAAALIRDLEENVQNWDYADPRLTTSTSAPCSSDPADGAAALLTDHSASTYTGFVGCANANLGAYGGVRGDWTTTGPLTTPQLTMAYSGGVDRFERFFTVREEDSTGNPAATPNSGARKRVWLFVTFQHGGRSYRLVHETVRYNLGGLL